MPYADPAVRRAYLREWKVRNRDRHRELNKYADAAIHANARAARFGAPGKLTADDVRRTLSVGRCHYCGKWPSLLTIDHVIPLNLLGPNTPANIVAACRSCNISKYRGDRPGRWARLWDACRDCATTERKHCCHGRCGRCHQRHAGTIDKVLR